MRTEFALHPNEQFEGEYDLYVRTDTLTRKTDHTIWRFNIGELWRLQTDPEDFTAFNLDLDFSIYKKPNSKGTIEGTKFEIIKILAGAVRNYSKIFSDERNYDFNIYDDIWNKEQSLQMRNLIIHL